MFILASASPRRKELLKELVDDFTIIPSGFDEDSINVDDVFKLPEILSFHKALEVFITHKDDIVLACDTIVVLDGKVLGKPKDKEDAVNMLKLLSDKMHYVVSGYTLMDKDKNLSRTVITKVYFNKLDDELIRRYVDTLSPLDKAGAYGIQDEDYHLVKKIEGSYSNVMGLPLEDIKYNCF